MEFCHEVHTSLEICHRMNPAVFFLPTHCCLWQRGDCVPFVFGPLLFVAGCGKYDTSCTVFSCADLVFFFFFSYFRTSPVTNLLLAWFLRRAAPPASAAWPGATVPPARRRIRLREASKPESMMGSPQSAIKGA